MDDRTIARREIEVRTLKTIKNLLTPAVVAEITRAYTREINRLIAEASGDDDALSGKVTAVHREDNGSIRAIDDGMYQQTLKTRA